MNEEFVIKESTLINTLLLIFFFLVLSGVIFTLDNDQENSISIYIKPFVLLVGFLIIGIKKTVSKKIIYKVNSEGIYYYKNQICNWNNFYCAFAVNDAEFTDINDNIKLVVQFYNENFVLMEQRLPFPQTLDKSASEIIDAINKFRSV